MWYPTSMPHGPYCVTCQSSRPGRPSRSRSVLPTCASPCATAQPGPGARDDRCRYASMRPCASRVAVGHTGAVGAVEVGADLLDPADLQDPGQPRGEPRRFGQTRVLPRVRVEERELLEGLGGAVDGARVERVAEHRARLDRVLGDHDAVLRARVDVGPHAVERAHAGGVGEVAVEARLGHAGVPTAATDLAEVPLGTERRAAGRRAGHPRS